MIALHVRHLALSIALVIGLTTAAMATPSGGSTISNAVTATYTDGSHPYVVQSNTVQTTIAAVSALTVTPKNALANAQADAFAVNAPTMRTFTITNTGNIADAYTITAVTLSAGSVLSISFVGPNGSIPVTIGGTVSPLVAPGGTIQASVVLATTGIGAGTVVNIKLSARTTATGTQNGLQADSGQQWAVGAIGATIGGIGVAGSAIQKTVDGLRAEQLLPGTAVTYQIAFVNSGQLPATNAVLQDTLPAGVHADPASTRINGAPVAAATLNGNILRIPIGTIVAGVATTVTFRAQVDGAQALGSTVVNIASLTADNVPALATTPASVFIGTSNVVYDGLSGSTSPIAGALVTLVDPRTLQPLKFATPSESARTSAAHSTSLNAAGANPFRTGVDGVYAFPLQSPALGTTASFDIEISAPGYINRLIGATLTPDPSGLLYSVALVSKDGQPLARAGSFALTTSNVMIADVFNLLGNLPLFQSKPISVTKTADKTTAAPGDRVMYSVAFNSNVQSVLGATTITDTLPAGLAYAPGTARVDGARSEPGTAGRALVWQLPALAATVAHTITYACVVLPGVAPNVTLTNSVTVAATIPGTTARSSGTSSVDVIVTSGVFSDRAVITGRVFIDAANTGHFREGDTPLGEVRLYLESGESVTTDRDGRFSFPGVRAGMHVIRIDETTLPAGVQTFSDRRIDSVRSPVRLIHGIMDGGLLQDVNFALAGTR